MIPGRVIAQAHDIIARQGADGDEIYIADAFFIVKGRKIIGANFFEPALRILNRVHFVNRDDKAPHAEKFGDFAILHRLKSHTVDGIRQDDGDIRINRRHRHIAHIFQMAGRVGDAETLAAILEIAIGHVNGNPLPAFILQPVGEKGKIYLSGRVGRGGDMVFGHDFNIIEQPPDQGGLSVIHMTAS